MEYSSSGSRLALHANFAEKASHVAHIVQSRLPTADFAFLVACFMEGLADESSANGALHLIAAMQFCGFRGLSGQRGRWQTRMNIA
jgi:hypothetical protein